MEGRRRPGYPTGPHGGSLLIEFRFPGRGLDLLCIGAHADDLEIGCGATLLRWIAEKRIARVRWVVLSGTGVRKDEALASARGLLEGVDVEVMIEGFRDGFFPYQGSEVKEFFETLKPGGDPDLVLTHFRHDLHQDHRLVSELTWNTFRDHTILEYEIPKYDADLATPNVFVAVTEELVRAKAAHIEGSFPSQSDKHWFTAETYLALARIRGLECRSPGGYAEAFHVRKLLIGA